MEEICFLEHSHFSDIGKKNMQFLRVRTEFRLVVQVSILRRELLAIMNTEGVARIPCVSRQGHGIEMVPVIHEEAAVFGPPSSALEVF